MAPQAVDMVVRDLPIWWGDHRLVTLPGPRCLRHRWTEGHVRSSGVRVHRFITRLVTQPSTSSASHKTWWSAPIAVNSSTARTGIFLAATKSSIKPAYNFTCSTYAGY